MLGARLWYWSLQEHVGCQLIKGALCQGIVHRGGVSADGKSLVLVLGNPEARICVMN
jgi:hypothetical protein